MFRNENSTKVVK